MFIQNVSLANIVTGRHLNPGSNSMLIQICDPDIEFPIPKYQFSKIFQFKFLDIERNDELKDKTWRCSELQGKLLVQHLQLAMDQNMNIIVHCHAGICRSGAVAEVGIMMGFEDTKVHRIPNLLVKFNMMKFLGWVYE